MPHQPTNTAYAREIGEKWTRAIKTRQFERISDLCRPGVRSRLLWPDGYASFESAHDLAAEIRHWYAESDPIEIQGLQVEPVGDKVSISYRFTLRERGEWLEVEQQIFAMLQDGLLSQLDLMCSGFRPFPSGAAADPPVQREPTLDSSLPAADAVLVANDNAVGSTCAILTPSIKAKLKELNSGQVLKVEVRDTTAQDDIESWSRLSGNELIMTTQEENGKMGFFLRKK